MWKAPQRPNNKVTQPFSSGLVTIYTVENIAKPGYMPREGLLKKAVLRYEEMRMGINRYYSAKQNQVDIERVIRCPRAGGVSSQDVAITENGRQYRVDYVQSVLNVWPESVDITLARIDQVYEVPDNVV